MTEKQFNINTAREINGGIRYGKIKTRSGHPVRVLCWNAKGWKPIVGLIDLGDIELPMKFTKEGKCDTRPNVTTSNDLIVEVEGGEV